MYGSSRQIFIIGSNALNDFFPIAEKNNIGIILAGIFNSGILAKGEGENITYFYDKIPEEVKQRYLKIANICKKYDVPVPAAAIQFCYTNKLVTSMILGMDRLDQVEQNLGFLNFPIPEDLWKDLLNEKLIDERCPI